jgi:hypothetical protein
LPRDGAQGAVLGGGLDDQGEGGEEVVVAARGVDAPGHVLARA